LILDWLGREGGYLLSWWLLVTMAGAAALPLVVRLLGGLPDKGVLLARATGLLLVGFVFWLLGSFGFLQNTAGGILIAWVIVLCVSLSVYFTRREDVDWRAWWHRHRVGILAGEALFIVLLFGWAIVRAHNPDTSSTEKPMDLMFMSSIMRSESFPPNDGWMAGYAISYYYFGYLIAAMLGTLSGLSSTLTFSLMIVLTVAMTGQAAYAVGYNLVKASQRNETIDTDDVRTRSSVSLPTDEKRKQKSQSLLASFSPILVGLLAAFFVVFAGNFQAPLIEVPYQARLAPEWYLSFWDTQERDEYPERAAARANGVDESVPVTLTPNDILNPANSGGLWLWWFRASRVVQDRDLNGDPIGIQPIDEFPQFSFLLADSHPHVMALPYVLLCIGLALNVLLRGRAPDTTEIVFYALCLGGLIFLNTWDGPIYMTLLVGAEALRRLQAGGALARRDWLALVVLGIKIVVLALVFYLPFLIGFRSQAGGILPNWIHPTLFRQYFLVFGPFVLILAPFLIIETLRAGRGMNWSAGLWTAAAALLGLLMLMALFSLIGALLGAAPTGWQDNIGGMLLRRLSHGVLSVMLLAGIAVVVGRLWGRSGNVSTDAQLRVPTPLYNAATGFALLLIGAGLALTLVPDYLYLRDVFGVRINTVFKFYYQGWVVFSLASAYAVYSVFSRLEGRVAVVPRVAFGVLTAAALVLASVYPILAIYNRSLQEPQRLVTLQPAPLSLDGGANFVASDPQDNDYYAIECLSNLVQGDDVVIVEAVEGSYNPNYGRVAALTGLPVLFNWPGHQSQWRGPTFAQIAGSRQADIASLYTSEQWDTVQFIIDRYGIDYIFFGSTERNKYSPAAETKFRDRFASVCDFGDSRFYVTGVQD
jgi:YYY domain-containing protein